MSDDLVKRLRRHEMRVGPGINGDCMEAADRIEALTGTLTSERENADRLAAALEHAQRMVNKALPQFNWGNSFLDASAITLLNEAPIAISRGLAAHAKHRQQED